jgi:spectinomycin phosphotransferase
MLEMFALEWRLDEVSLGADWFEAPHTGTADDHEAYAGLLQELAGPTG